MGLLDNKLSALMPGSHVRITNLAGQIIEGVVAENDGKEAVSVRVTTLATIRYDQIGMIDEFVQFGNISQGILTENNAAMPANSEKEKSLIVKDKKAAIVEVKKTVCDKDTVSSAYKAMGAEERKALEPSYNKFQSYLKSHDDSKYEEAINLIWQKIDDNGWDYDPGVNLFLAYVQLAHKEYRIAAESFFYADSIRFSYCTAYQGTDDDASLYPLAAAFSAIYLSSASPDESLEALTVLRKSSAAAKDITGIKYALAHSQSAQIKEMLLEILQESSSDCCENEVKKMIDEYLAKDSDTDSDTADAAEPSETAAETAVEACDEPDIDKEYEGQISGYNFFDEKGTIKSKDGKEYPFEVKNITDEKLRSQVKNMTKNKFEPIAVKFTLAKYANKYVVSSLRRQTDCEMYLASVSKDGSDEGVTMYTANTLFKNKNYTGAIEIYKRYLNSRKWETAFANIIKCYLSLSNENAELGYLEELCAFVEQYENREIKLTNALESLQQFYIRIHDYAKAVNVTNELIQSCAPLDYRKILHYTIVKEHCYKSMKNSRAAVSELLNWLDILKRNKITDHNDQRDSYVYIELAELYFELEDYENSENYIRLSNNSERKSVLRQKLDAVNAPLDSAQETDDDDEIYEDIDAISEPEESLQTAYDSYTDTAGFDALDTDDTAVVGKALGFGEQQLYCLLTYLNCAAVLSADSKKTRTDENGNTVYVGQAINAVNAAVSYAFNSPLAQQEYQSTEIIAVFDEAQKYLPNISQPMFAASALYALFNTPQTPDYSFGDFAVVVGEYGLDRYTALLPLISDLADFRESTGYGMDSFADYKTSGLVIEAIIEEANDHIESIDMRNDTYESQGQVRRLREFIFSGENSELRTCLNIVAANETEKLTFVKSTMSQLFIRSGKPVSADNLDIKKIDKYIDRFWDMARDVIQDEGRHIARPHDKVKGAKRTNIVNTIRRILSCICNWLSAAELTIDNNNDFATSMYNKLAPKVISELNSLKDSCEAVIAEKGFDWGTQSIRLAAAELLAKLNGTYSSKARRYFFIDFLKGEDILLNDSFLPEIQSTFCGVTGFDILSRIERHASRDHLSLSERFTEILSDVESKHNFRTAGLIKAYGEDMGITDITDHKNLSQYNECLKQAKQRFESKCQEFSDELELSESYGVISNINKEKDKIMAIASCWYRISRLTGDYGFYVRLLEVMRHNISVNAQEKAERLLNRLDLISSKPNYNFGAFSREMIVEKINDQNFSSAEYIMGRIVMGDVNFIADYADEPLSYFNEFTDEYATNYRAVSNAGRNIVDAIFSYSDKKELDKALAYLTNNAHKETRGGANLLKSWLSNSGHTSAEQLTTLLNRLGFKPISVKPDENIDFEAYNVFCRKQTGKVNFVHNIPAFGSKTETEGFRVLCLYGTYNCNSLMDKFRSANSTAKHTLVLLDYALGSEERRKLAKCIKQEKSFAKTFIVLDRVAIFYLAKHYTENAVIKRLMAITLPYSYYQPFVEASSKDMPPELFTGREAELTSIESPEGANLVYGGRQLGKSALLKMARGNIDKNANGDRAIWIEIKDLTAAETLKVVCDKLITEEVLDESCECSTWNELAGKIQRRLNDQNPETRINYLLLMLDEADTFIETSAESEDQPITALKNLPSDRFKLVMAGLHNLSRYDRKSMHQNSNLIHLKSITIRQFNRKEATKLLTSILAYLGFRFTQTIIDNILAATYNYPGLIQLYCQKLLEAMQSDDYAGYLEFNTPPYEVTESHYKKILSDKTFIDMVNEKFEATLFTEEKGRSNYHIIALIIAYLYYCEPNEKGYSCDDILRIAGEYRINRVTSLTPDQFSEILGEMCDLNVVTVMDDNYLFATDGFRHHLGSQEEVEQKIAKYIEEEI